MSNENVSVTERRPDDIAGFSGKYRFLSNFWPSKMLPPALEHHYQAAKCEYPDSFMARGILACATPGLAKRLGKRAKLRPDWDRLKDQIMLDLVRRKFTDHDLKLSLLFTEHRRLIELNTWGDQYWGMTEVYGKLMGRNQLGITLMQVRDEIQRAEKL